MKWKFKEEKIDILKIPLRQKLHKYSSGVNVLSYFLSQLATPLPPRCVIFLSISLRAHGLVQTTSRRDRRVTTSDAPTFLTSAWRSGMRPCVRSWIWSRRPSKQRSWRPSRRRGVCVWELCRDRSETWGSRQTALSLHSCLHIRTLHINVPHLWTIKAVTRAWVLLLWQY